MTTRLSSQGTEHARHGTRRAEHDRHPGATDRRDHETTFEQDTGFGEDAEGGVVELVSTPGRGGSRAKALSRGLMARRMGPGVRSGLAAVVPGAAGTSVAPDSETKTETGHGERADAEAVVAASSPAAGAMERALARLSAAVGGEAYERYFVEQSTLHLVEGRLEVRAVSGFVATVIERRFAGPLRAAAAAAFGEGERALFRVMVDPQAAPATAKTTKPAKHADREPKAPAREAVAPASSPRARGLHAGRVFRLESFVVGESNQLAYSAALSVADPSQRPAFRSVFIHGACGTGKTHLLQGIVRAYLGAGEHGGRAARAAGRERAIYMTGEAFTNGFVAAVRESRTEAFRKQFEHIELLCIDDVHFVQGKMQTQQELQHLFDRLISQGVRVVLASDAPPAKIARLNATLGSRFASGLVVRISPPDASLQRALVERFASERGLPLTPEASALIAARAARLGASAGGASVRDIEGMLTQVDAVFRLLPELCAEPGRIGAGLVRRALGLGEDDAGGRSLGATVGTNGTRRAVTVDGILSTVAAELAVDAGEVLGRGRHPRVVLTRAMVTLLARRMTTASFPEIARTLGRPNHSTVITALRRIERQVEAGETIALGLSWDGLTVGELASRLEAAVGGR